MRRPAPSGHSHYTPYSPLVYSYYTLTPSLHTPAWGHTIHGHHRGDVLGAVGAATATAADTAADMPRTAADTAADTAGINPLPATVTTLPFASTLCLLLCCRRSVLSRPSRRHARVLPLYCALIEHSLPSLVLSKHTTITLQSHRANRHPRLALLSRMPSCSHDRLQRHAFNVR